MSRGLGRLQREILDSLDASTDQGHAFRAGSNGHSGVHVDTGEPFFWPRTARYHGLKVEVPEHVYDVHAVSAYLAKARAFGRLDYGNQDWSFRASFSRALRGLVQRGLLVPVVPVPDELTGWTFADVNEARRRYQVRMPQLRFVRRA